MSERDEKSGNVGCFILGVIGLIVPVLYVFGLKPACWLETHVSLPISLLKTVYAPLVFVADNCEPIGELFDMVR